MYKMRQEIASAASYIFASEFFF